MIGRAVMASKSDLPPSVPGTASRDGFKESEEGETEGPRESDGVDHVTPGAAAGHAIGPPPRADLKPRLDISLPVTDISIVPGDAENPDRLRRRREIREKQQQAERYLRAMGQVRPAHATLDIPWQERLLECVLKMKPDAFERLCQRILKESGFIKVDVTGRGGDGGIDGIGVLRLNLLSFHVFFQCKRWKGSVGAPVIPVMETGSSDSIYTMAAGMPSYGISGIAIDIDDVRAHGRDERVGMESFDRGNEFFYRYLKALTSQ